MQIGYFRNRQTPALFIFNADTLQFVVFIPNNLQNNFKDIFNLSTFFKLTRGQFGIFKRDGLVK